MESELNSNLKLLAKSSVIVFIGIFLSKLFTYLYKIIIGRYYGPEVYGTFSLALSILGILTAIASLGLIDGLTRFIPIYLSQNKKPHVKFIMDFSKKVLLFTSMTCGVLLFIFSNLIAESWFNLPKLSIYLKIFALAIPFQVIAPIYMNYFRGIEKIKLYSFSLNILPNISKLILIFIFVYFGLNSIFSISLSYLMSMIFLFLFVFIYYSFNFRLSNGTLPKSEKKKVRKDLFSYSWPLLFFGIGSYFVFWTDSFCLGILKDSTLVGIYNAALPLAFLICLFSEIFVQLFFPLITKHLSLKKFSLASELTKQVTKWIFIISLPVLIILLIFPEQIINLFWGTEYISGAIALRLLAIGYFFFSLSSISNNILASLGKSKIILYNLFAVSIINLGMNLLLIPNYGIVGAAFATMTSLSLWAILILLEVYYFTKINPFRRKIINVGISAGIFFLFLSYVDLPFIWSILLSLVLYVVLLFLTRAWDKNDNELKRTTFEKIKIFLNNWIIHRQ